MQEKKLRDVLVEIFMRIHACDSEDDCCGLLDWIQEAAKEALAATTGETEMEKLVAWVIEDGGDYQFFNEPETASIRLDRLLEYITTQFGEEEGDADREGD